MFIVIYCHVFLSYLIASLKKVNAFRDKDFRKDPSLLLFSFIGDNFDVKQLEHSAKKHDKMYGSIIWKKDGL